MANGCAPLPLEILQEIRAFIAAGKSGQIALNFNGGSLVTWKIIDNRAVQTEGKFLTPTR